MIITNEKYELLKISEEYIEKLQKEKELIQKKIDAFQVVVDTITKKTTTHDELDAEITMGLIMEIPAGCYFHRGNMNPDLWVFRNANDRVITSDRKLKELLLKAKAMGWGI